MQVPRPVRQVLPLECPDLGNDGGGGVQRLLQEADDALGLPRHLLGTAGTFLFYALGQYDLLGWLPGWLTSSGLAYGVIALMLSAAGVFLGIAFGRAPSERVLARYDGTYYAGREEMYELNQKMKTEEADAREAAPAGA